jgi:hypothetical protein
VRAAVAASVSIAATLRKLGVADNSRGRAWLREQVAAAGIDDSHFLGQAHQRGRPGPKRVRPAAEVLVKREDGSRTGTFLLRRAMAQMGVAELCAQCGTGPVWRGKPMTLEVDHVNGDRNDDRLENLRLLCPNCHAVTGTWCRGGRAGARIAADEHR